MQESSMFSAQQWIADSLVSAEQLAPETLQAAGNFTLMWNVFEALMCDNSATLSRLEKLSAEIVSRRRCQGQIERLFFYFQNLFYTGSGFTPEYSGLGLRATDRKAFIEAVLRGEIADYEARLLALLFLLYRIHKNLFCGPKSLDRLNRQAASLTVACRALALLIEAQGRHFKRRRYSAKLPG